VTRRRILLVVASVVVVAVAYLVVRDDGPADGVAAGDGATTTTERASASSGGGSRASDTTTSPASAPPPTASVPGSTVPSAPPATTAPTTTAPAPPFQHSIETVTIEQLGSSWNPDLGCSPPEQLRAVNVSHWGYDGAVHQGRIVVDAGHAERTVAIFRDIYAAGFPIERMVPIDAYGGDDQASMRANNTSGFNCRRVAGTTRLSEHGLGRAIDVNPLVNPYVRGATVDPPEGAPYADRSRTDQGMIHAGDAVVQAFERQGWGWGGYWSSGQDYQHFSWSGR
jgi:hypothetical protein